MGPVLFLVSEKIRYDTFFDSSLMPAKTQHMKVIQDDNGISLTSTNGAIYTLRMNRGPNLVNPEFNRAMRRAIETIEKEVDHPKSLVLTGNGKFFSNGLDLEFLQRSSDEDVGRMFQSVWRHGC